MSNQMNITGPTDSVIPTLAVVPAHAVDKDGVLIAAAGGMPWGVMPWGADAGVPATIALAGNKVPVMLGGNVTKGQEGSVDASGHFLVSTTNGHVKCVRFLEAGSTGQVVEAEFGYFGVIGVADTTTIGDAGETTTILGRLRVGTGSTPTLATGDDDLFVEGKLEVDGASQFDGAIGLNGAVTVGAGGFANSAPSLYRTTLVVPFNGKGTTVVLAGADHPKLRVVGVNFHLTEVPDASATTLTCKLTRTVGGAGDICADKTFTQGTDTVGKVLAGTIDTAQDNIPVACDLNLVVGGTTTTLGRGVAYIDVVGE